METRGGGVFDGDVGVGGGVVSQHLILRSRSLRRLSGRGPQVLMASVFERDFSGEFFLALVFGLRAMLLCGS